MISTDAFIETLLSDPIANRHEDISRQLTDARGRLYSGLSDFMMHLLPRVEDSLPDLETRRAFAAYVVDSFWEAGRIADLDITTKQIKDLARNIPVLKAYDEPVNSEFSSLADCLYTSADLLQFTWGKYRGFLKENFSDAFVVGSLNYGRFYSIRGKEHIKKSDIDLTLVPIASKLNVSAFGVNVAPINMLDVDTGDRLVRWLASSEGQLGDMLNYKLFQSEKQVEVSINIGTPTGIRNILNFRDAANETCSVDRTISMGGRENILSDLTGTPFSEQYSEKPIQSGFILELRHYTDRYGGLTAMFTPRVGRLYSSPRTDGIFTAFEMDLAAHLSEHRQAGKTVSLCNAHPRRSRFSPLFKEKCDAVL